MNGVRSLMKDTVSESGEGSGLGKVASFYCDLVYYFEVCMEMRHTWACFFTS